MKRKTFSTGKKHRGCFSLSIYMPLKRQMEGKMRISNESEVKLRDIHNKSLQAADIPDKANEKRPSPDKQKDILEISNKAKDMFYEQMEQIKESSKAQEKANVDLAKLMAIARRIARGDKVPASDEKKLLEHNPKLYQMAKMSAMLNANKNKKKHDALFKDEDQDNMNEKIGELESVEFESGTTAIASENVEEYN